MSHNTESNNNGWIFLAGLATGAAVGYLFNTDRGRQVRNEAADKAMEYGEQAKSFAVDKYSSAATTVSGIVDMGKAYATEVSIKLLERIKSGAEEVRSAAENAETAFQRGANRPSQKNRPNEMSAS